MGSSLPVMLLMVYRPTCKCILQSFPTWSLWRKYWVSIQSPTHCNKRNRNYSFAHDKAGYRNATMCIHLWTVYNWFHTTAAKVSSGDRKLYGSGPLHWKFANPWNKVHTSRFRFTIFKLTWDPSLPSHTGWQFISWFYKVKIINLVNGF